VQAGVADSTTHDVIVGVIGNAIFWILFSVGQTIFAKTAKRNPAYRRLRFGLIISGWVVLNIVLALCTQIWPWFLAISLIPIAIIVGSELNQFWKIGLVGADKEVRAGIDYVNALRMCQNSLDFLGIGAGKLVQNQNEFKAAIDRCNREDRPVRLLLIQPTDPGLERIAKMAGKDPQAYRKGVIETLRFIARLRNEEHKNIQVRLYKDFQAFRLMLINDSICLISYYVLGKGDGSNLPQLHIVKTASARDVDSLYYGFSAYFGKIWDDHDSQEWNFRDFIE
jgi:hypothetical protein